MSIISIRNDLFTQYGAWDHGKSQGSACSSKIFRSRSHQTHQHCAGFCILLKLPLLLPPPNRHL